MRVSILLKDYEGILKAQEIYALLALTSYYNRYYNQCSKAFMKLESLADVPESDWQAFSEIAMTVFTTHKPTDPKKLRGQSERRPSVTSIKEDAAKNREICVASGKVIRDSKWKRCKRCKHPMLLVELKHRIHCPLCHASLVSPPASNQNQNPNANGASPGFASTPSREDAQIEEDPRFKNLFSALN